MSFGEKKGFSVLEAVISILIIGLLVDIFAASFVSVRVNKINENKGLANQFAALQVEALKDYPIDSLTSGVETDCLGFAYNWGDQKIVAEGKYFSLPNALKLSPASNELSNNISSIALLNEGYYQDFTFSGYFNVADNSVDDWQAGIVFRVEDSANYYEFVIDSTSLNLSKVEEGVLSIIYTELQIFSEDEWEALKVVTSGSSISIYLNDIFVAEVSDSSFSVGHLGFIGHDSTYYFVDNISLQSAARNRDWDFDSSDFDRNIDGFLTMYPWELHDFTCSILPEDYVDSTIKKVTVKVQWTENTKINEIVLYSLKQ